MTAFRKLATALLASAALAGITPADDRPTGPPELPSSYGPWWVHSSRPGGSKRPDKIDRDVTAVGIGEMSSPMGVQVWVWGDVADLTKGGQYELRYQIRVHTTKGDCGPLLGTSALPKGTAPVLLTATADDKWNGMEAPIDITRKDLTAMTNLPLPPKGKESHTVFLRVEPHLYDLTKQTYLTPAKSEAIILAARVWSNGKVWEVHTLSEYLVMNRGDTVDSALGGLADLDAYDPTANGVERAIERVLDMPDVPAATKAKFVAAIPADRLNWKTNFGLKRTLEKYADGNDDVLKAAATKKLAEAK